MSLLADLRPLLPSSPWISMGQDSNDDVATLYSKLLPQKYFMLPHELLKKTSGIR